MIGAGAWVDKGVAVSCTGESDAFIRASAAFDLAASVRAAERGMIEAAPAMLETVRSRSGDGGLISLSCAGATTMSFGADGMERAARPGTDRDASGRWAKVSVTPAE